MLFCVVLVACLVSVATECVFLFVFFFILLFLSICFVSSLLLIFLFLLFQLYFLVSSFQSMVPHIACRGERIGQDYLWLIFISLRTLRVHLIFVYLF